MAKSKEGSKRLVPTCPLGHVVLALEEYFGSRGGHGITGEVAAIFEPHIYDDEVRKYCIDEYGLSVLHIAEIRAKIARENEATIELQEHLMQDLSASYQNAR